MVWVFLDHWILVWFFGSFDQWVVCWFVGSGVVYWFIRSLVQGLVCGFVGILMVCWVSWIRYWLYHWMFLGFLDWVLVGSLVVFGFLDGLGMDFFGWVLFQILI